jgi:hypothetical protein
MRAGYPEGWIFLGLLFLEPVAPPGANSRNVSAIAKSGAQAQPVQGSVIFADQQFGSNMGAKIVAANTALGPAKGEIRVAESGDFGAGLVVAQSQLDLRWRSSHVDAV